MLTGAESIYLLIKSNPLFLEIHKVLMKISKESNCEAVVDWIKPCTNHFYWSVTTTITGSGRVIWAKFKSYLSHIVNKHEKLDDPLFNKCAHPKEIPQRKWLQKGITNLQIVDMIRDNLQMKLVVSPPPSVPI